MVSKCPHCKGFSFEIVEQSPMHSNYKVWFVQCSSCGSPVGAMEYFNAGAKIEQVNQRIQSLESKIDNLENLLHNLIRQIR